MLHIIYTTVFRVKQSTVSIVLGGFFYNRFSHKLESIKSQHASQQSGQRY